MAIREQYSDHGYYEMFGALQYGEAEMPTGGILSSLSVDTQGFDAVTVIINIGSCDVSDSASCVTIRLMHADSTGSADYANVSTTDLIGSGWLVNSGATISFGGSMALTSGIIMDFDIPAASILSGEGTWAFGYIGKKRYIKLMIESTGSVNTGSIIMCAMAIPGIPGNWPVCDPYP
jgi:hypothetical protein